MLTYIWKRIIIIFVFGNFLILKKSACEKDIKSIDFSNIFITDALQKPVVYVKYYQQCLKLNVCH